MDKKHWCCRCFLLLQVVFLFSVSRFIPSPSCSSAELQNLLLHVRKRQCKPAVWKKKRRQQLSNCNMQPRSDETRPPVFGPDPGMIQVWSLFTQMCCTCITNYGWVISSTFAPVNSFHFIQGKKKRRGLLINPRLLLTSEGTDANPAPINNAHFIWGITVIYRSVSCFYSGHLKKPMHFSD